MLVAFKDVLARSAMHHSANYRSAVLLGTARPIEDPDELARGFETIVERIVPGRWPDVRPPSQNEMKATALLALTVFLVHNTAANLAKRGIASGFHFLENVAGFQPTFSLIPFDLATSTNGRVFLLGLVNTLVVSAIGIVFATLLGFIIGIARLSQNYLIRTLAAVYVDVIRNIPLLAQIIFWYFGVLSTLPNVRQSLNFLGFLFLNQRGLFMPAPILEAGFWIIPAALVVGIIAAIVVYRWARRRQMLTGQ